MNKSRFTFNIPVNNNHKIVFYDTFTKNEKVYNELNKKKYETKKVGQKYYYKDKYYTRSNIDKNNIKKIIIYKFNNYKNIGIVFEDLNNYIGEINIRQNNCNSFLFDHELNYYILFLFNKIPSESVYYKSFYSKKFNGFFYLLSNPTTKYGELMLYINNRKLFSKILLRNNG